MAFLVVLDELSPEQRLAVVLHDVLGLDFADISEVIGCSVTMARQHAARGRRRLSDLDPAPRQPADLAWAVLGEMSTARRPVVGAAKVGGFLAGLVSRYGSGASVEPVLVNGDPGFLVRVNSARPQDAPVSVYTVAVRGRQIVALYAVLAPDKLTRLN